MDERPGAVPAVARPGRRAPDRGGRCPVQQVLPGRLATRHADPVTTTDDLDRADPDPAGLAALIGLLAELGGALRTGGLPLDLALRV